MVTRLGNHLGSKGKVFNGRRLKFTRQKAVNQHLAAPWMGILLWPWDAMGISYPLLAPPISTIMDKPIATSAAEI